MPKAKQRWACVLVAVLVLVAVVEIARRIVLANSLYRLNLRTQAPLRTMPPPLAGRKVVIFAPHPDDETLGCGGYIQQAVQAGADVHVVMVTNGEYPEIDVLVFDKTVRMRPEAFIRLGYRRQRETSRALGYLGLPSSRITFLGYPNGYLYDLWLPGNWLPNNPVRSARTRTTRSPYDNSLTPRAVYCGQSLLHDIETVLLHEKPDAVITVHPNDIHMDHWPTYAFVRFALDELASQGQVFAQRCSLYTYLIHRSYWPAPRGYRPWVTLEPPAPLAALGRTEWLALPLTVAQMIDKRKAIAMYRTQAGSIDPLLQSFARGNELYGVTRLNTWPIHQTVPSTMVVTDPSGDLATSAANPSGDITGIRLARSGDSMDIRIQTRKPPATGIGYHVSIDAGGAAAGDRVLARYDWQNGRRVSMIYKNEKLRPLGNNTLSVSLVGKMVVYRSAWPLDDARQTFFIVRAWTTRGERLVDQTAATRLWIGQLPPGIAVESPAVDLTSEKAR